MAAATKKGSKKKSKMTWARLANDPSISKSELPRIAAAFGLKKPKGPGLRLKGEESSTPKKSNTDQRRRKTTATSTSTKPKPKTTPRTGTTARDAGPERAYRPRHHGRTPTQTRDAGPEGVYKRRIRVRTRSGKAGRGTTIERLGPTKARNLFDARGRYKGGNVPYVRGRTRRKK